MRPDRAAWIRLTDPAPPHVARPWDEIAADMDAARRTGAADLLLGGGEPTRSPDLLRALDRARREGFQATVVTDGHALTSARRLDALRDAGATHVAVRLRGPDAEAHERAAGPGAWERASAALGALAGHALSGSVLALLDEAGPRVEAWVALAERVGLALRLVRRLGPPPPHAPPLPASLAEALDRAWQAAAARGVQVDVDDVAWSPPALDRDLPPPLLDRNLVELFDRGFLPATAASGVRAVGPGGGTAALRGALERGGSLRQLGPALAVSGAPPVDLPACLGGEDRALDTTPRAQQEACPPCPRSDRCPGVPLPLHGLVTVRPPPLWSVAPPRRAVVLHPWLHDKLLAASVLPALAVALRARGVDTTLASCWDLPFDPHDLSAPVRHGALARGVAYAWRTLTRRPDPLGTYRPPDGRLGHPFRWAEDEARARAIDATFWRQLDLSGADLVIAPGWEAAERAATHPTWPQGARLVVADLHMLVGAHAWMQRRLPDGALPKHGAWWPGDHVEVHACFPRFQGLYRALGIPLDRILWRPYPLWSGHVPPGPPPPECDAIFSGGRHARDFATLAEAGRRLRGRVHPIRVHAEPGVLDAEPPFEPLGMAELPTFVETIRTSRFVVLPLVHDAVHAAGISVAALALASGRPVIATRTPAMLDHVRDGVDGLLVEPGDPDALAAAIARVDREEALLGHLAAGARTAALRLSVERWATELVHGIPPVGSHRSPGAEGGTRYAW